ncbi:hypothetical protein DFP73DRAFT_566301 [Morchella snyderi]|nr:hypothetical protein DFP73DRAFT_566301 [Morchella snyderi]
MNHRPINQPSPSRPSTTNSPRSAIVSQRTLSGKCLFLDRIVCQLKRSGTKIREVNSEYQIHCLYHPHLPSAIRTWQFSATSDNRDHTIHPIFICLSIHPVDGLAGHHHPGGTRRKSNPLMVTSRAVISRSETGGRSVLCKHQLVHVSLSFVPSAIDGTHIPLVPSGFGCKLWGRNPATTLQTGRSVFFVPSDDIRIRWHKR